MDLEKLRAKIDEVDAKLLGALAERADIVLKVAQYKRAHGLEPLQPERFAHMLAERIAAGEKLGIPPQLVTEVWTAIHDSSVDMQEKAL